MISIGVMLGIGLEIGIYRDTPGFRVSVMVTA